MDPILKKSFAIFTEWVSNAKIAFPNLSFNITEPSFLTVDLKHALELTKNKLKEDEIEKGITFNYDIFCILLQNSLNTQWYGEYIQKQLFGNKIFIALTILSDVIKTTNTIKIKLNDTYSEVYKRHINIDDIDEKISVDVPEELTHTGIEETDNQVINALENLKIHFLYNKFHEKVPEFIADIKEYFTKEEIETIWKEGK